MVAITELGTKIQMYVTINTRQAVGRGDPVSPPGSFFFTPNPLALLNTS